MLWLRGRRWGRLLRGRLEGVVHVFMIGIVNEGMAFGIAFLVLALEWTYPGI